MAAVTKPMIYEAVCQLYADTQRLSHDLNDIRDELATLRSDMALMERDVHGICIRVEKQTLRLERIEQRTDEKRAPA